MITISRTVLQQLRTVVRKGLGVTKRRPSPNINFDANHAGLRIRVITDNSRIEHFVAGQFAPGKLAVSFDLFRECDAGKASEVSIQPEGDQVVASWVQAGIPQAVRSPAQEPDDVPTTPDSWSSNSEELLTTIQTACGTTDRESGRYALSHLRLRGSDGQIAATDGRQLLAISGFDFPWEGEILMPASKVFDCADFIGHRGIDVGVAGDWAVIRTGPWTLWLKIERTKRFPEIDSMLQDSSQAPTLLTLAEPDAKFLLDSLKHLPGDREHNSPLTVDLNGAVTVRCKAGDADRVTELKLTGSQRQGKEVRFAANRRFVARAIRLGFRQFRIGDPESPVVAQEGNRTYVWANLSETSVIPPTPGAVRIESPLAGHRTHPQPRRQFRRQAPGLEKILAALRGTADTMSRLLGELERLPSNTELSHDQLRAIDA